MNRTKFQVLAVSANATLDKDFSTRKAAEKYRKELASQGVKATIWDCRNNSLSGVFPRIF